MIRKGLRPGIKFDIDRDDDAYELRRDLTFRQSWLLIMLLIVMDIIFILPAIFTFSEATAAWGQTESVFDLAVALFLSAWLLGWVTAPLIMTTILVLLVFGREVIKARPGDVEIFLGLPFAGISAHYDVTKMRNLRIEKSLKNPTRAWRGTHLAFDYGANQIDFGSDISADELITLEQQLQEVTGTEIRKGDALPEELQTRWEQATPSLSRSPLATPTSRSTPTPLTSPSILLLIVVNLIPIVGNVFLGWKLADVMVLYWAESAVIGFFNICKMAVIGRWAVLLTGLFFIGHFGGFMSVHFLFIYTIFVKNAQNTSVAAGDLTDLTQLFVGLWPALLALFFSHAYSFYHNFLGRREYRGKTLKAQMTEPYSRIIFMHLVLIFGGGLAMITGGARPILIIVIGLKIYFDIRAHRKQH